MSTYTQDASASSNSEAQELRCVITDIDALSQSGFSQIESIAKLALLSLQTPSGYRHIDDIATALEAIVYKAQDIQDCVNSQAENVGCNYIDEDERKRWKARDESRSAA